MKTAVVLFNLGGPDRLSSVRPFLQNLFSDPAIIDLPGVLRHPLAWFIASKRDQEAQGIYKQLGGGSPLLKNTQDQAKALETELGEDYACFVCMRYWHPLTPDVVEAVKKYDPDRVILLPLYPQFSTTTSLSSLKLWEKTSREKDLLKPTFTVNCYPDHPGFIQAVAQLIQQTLSTVQTPSPRLLFTAHGLPKKIVEKGDPYPQHVEKTVAGIVETLNIPELDYQICYQSRVGPLEWIRPYTDEEIQRSGQEGKSLVIVPVAFVSEHSETLVELDREYKDLAKESGVKGYYRVPTVATHPQFIQGLADLVHQAETFTCPIGDKTSFSGPCCGNFLETL